MDIKHYVLMFWRWAWLMVLVTAVAAGVSYWFSSTSPQLYRATTTLIVGQVINTPEPSQNDFATSERLAQTYVQLVRRQPLLEATLEALGVRGLSWQALARQVSANAVTGTQLLQISVVGPDTRTAMRIADEIANQLIRLSPTPQPQEIDTRQKQAFVGQQLSTLQARITDAEQEIKKLEDRLVLETTARGVQDVQSQIAGLQAKISGWQSTYATMLSSARGGRTNTLSVVEPAVAPAEPISPNVLLDTLLAAGVALLLSIIAILLIEYLDDRIKSAEEADRVLKLPVLGAVGHLRKVRRASDSLVASVDGGSPVAEDYRLLRTNLRFTRVSHPEGTLVVTSAVPGEGKSTTVSNVAVSLAQAGMRVLLCDADLRRPSIHKIFQLTNDVGLTSLLLDSTLSLESALSESGVPNLMLLSSGPLPPNPSDLLGSEAMKQRLQHMQQVADVVLFDCPALLPVADAAVLAALCSGAVLVVNAHRTRSDVARKAKALLDQIGIPTLGVVLNDVRASRRGYGDYYLTKRRTSGRSPWARIAAVWGSVFSGAR